MVRSTIDHDGVVRGATRATQRGSLVRVGPMLDPFVSTRPRHTARPAVLLLSIATHALLIYVAFSPRAGSVRRAAGEVALDHPPGIERIRYIEMTPSRAPVTSKARAKPKAVASLTLPRLQALSIELAQIPAPATIADIDLSSKVNDRDSAAAPVARLSDVLKEIVGNPTPGAGRVGPYSKDEVDRVVAPLANNPKPVYPWRLERQGVETSFIAQFVVDSTGRVDSESINFPTTVHALFIESVRESLRRARFYPAQVGGRRVRQLVEQQFTFVVIDSRDSRRTR
jgi:periplasmic protein TonB